MYSWAMILCMVCSLPVHGRESVTHPSVRKQSPRHPMRTRIHSGSESSEYRHAQAYAQWRSAVLGKIPSTAVACCVCPGRSPARRTSASRRSSSHSRGRSCSAARIACPGLDGEGQLVLWAILAHMRTRYHDIEPRPLGNCQLRMDLPCASPVTHPECMNHRSLSGFGTWKPAISKCDR